MNAFLEILKFSVEDIITTSSDGLIDGGDKKEEGDIIIQSVNINN